MTKNMWDERYARDDFFYGKQPNDFLKEHGSRIPAGGRVLCLAEGEGRNAVFLAEQGFAVTAVDMSAVGLQKAKDLAAERQVSIETQCIDLNELLIVPESWDAIVSIWCHVPSNLRARLYSDCVKGLKPGGFFLLEAYTAAQIPLNTGGPKEPDLLPSSAALRNELKGLDFLIAREIRREIHEGIGHQGMSEVVQILAQKLN
jgi:2-polyprenyl-3-methyl-5-hydroxy-6-metoxy-1,4-benzoquinol methylase